MTIHGKYLSRTAESEEQGLLVEFTVQRPDDWTKRRRSALHEKPESEVFLLSAPSTHVRPARKTIMLGSDSSVASALIARSALRTKLQSWSSSITKHEHHRYLHQITAPLNVRNLMNNLPICTAIGILVKVLMLTGWLSIVNWNLLNKNY